MLTGYKWEHKIKYLLNPPKETPFKPICCVYKDSKVFQLGTFYWKEKYDQQSPEGRSVSLCFRALLEGQNVIL